MANQTVELYAKYWPADAMSRISTRFLPYLQSKGRTVTRVNLTKLFFPERHELVLQNIDTLLVFDQNDFFEFVRT